jgi:hypothetical protein
MAKTKISEYSSTSAGAGLNTDIASINIDEGCAPSGINNAIRALMAQVKDLQSGASGDTIPVAAGGTGSTTAATARTALSAAASGANSDITSITGLTTALTVAQGGTGAATLTTAYGVLAAGTTATGSLQNIGTGTSAQVLTSNGTGALPTFQDAAASPYVLKNRIINGAMVIDQRNAGASYTAPSGSAYALDRMNIYSSQASKFTIQQNAGSVTPPTGFTNYLGITSSSAYTVGSAELFVVGQPIEGYNTADLAWGTANAKTITLFFWVRSSLTGTFGGSLRNNAADRSYPFSYTISSANTWEQKSITITGDTSGTWLTTNGVGIYVYFGLGVGSTLSSTAGAWAAGNYLSSTGATSVVGTNGATWYVTGVQLEIGSTATPFERRLYNQELANCQRYYIRYKNQSPSGYVLVATGRTINSTYGDTFFSTPVSMRTAPTLNYSALGDFQSAYGTATTISFEQTAAPFTTMGIYVSPSTIAGGNQVQILQFQNVNLTTAFIDFSAEL